MKEKLRFFISEAIKELKFKGKIKTKIIPEIDISIPQNRVFGDYSTNIALVLSSLESCDPKMLAEEISLLIKNMKPAKGILKDIVFAGKGFINFFIDDDFLRNNLLGIKKLGPKYGMNNFGKGKKVLIEFVSANPTGPLHIGHGRWAVIGDSLARIFEKSGYRVKREYYVNDVGNQIENLLASIKAKAQGKSVPEGGYVGSYINDIAEKVKNKIESPKIRDIVLEIMLKEVKDDLEALGVKYDNFVFESMFHKSGEIKKILEELKKKNVTFTEHGALWFKSQEFGDDKNRVLVREDGQPTYFASDIAYHKDKFKRGYDLLINVWGTDHHGYVPRLKFALKVLGLPVERLEIIIGQLVTLYRGKEPVRMSKRTGELITLREIIEEIGKDEVRFFLCMLSPDTHLDFDIELAKKKSHENPVYYVQYAHARICSILLEAEKKGYKKKDIGKKVNLSLLSDESERNIMLKLLLFPDCVEDSARLRLPHLLTIYARDLATVFHNYYQKIRVITSDGELTKARLTLVYATRIVLENVLELLGISAPERM